MKTVVGWLLVGGALIGCSVRFQTPIVLKPSIPQSAQECSLRGGNWTALGLPGAGVQTCALKAVDAGKVCTDTEQCEGTCLAATDAVDGSRGKGHCSAYLSNFGNVKQLNRGIVEKINIQ
jgi:hypothetical protein